MRACRCVLLALLACVGQAAGCSDALTRAELGLELRIADEVAAEALAQVRTLVIRSSGDESYEGRVALDRTLNRVERIVYLPAETTRSVSLTVLALDGTEAMVAQGSSSVVSLEAVGRTVVEIVLAGGPGSSSDAGPADAADAAQPDLGAPDASLPDLSPTCVDPAGSYGYVLRKLPAGATPSIDGICNEPYWANAPTLSFTGANTTNNGAPVCRLLWEPGTPGRVHGCCTVTDADLRSTRVTPDSDTWNDDGVEYFLKGTTVASFDATSSKVIVNLVGNVTDTAPNSSTSMAYDGMVVSSTKLTGTLNDTTADTGYAIEWRASLRFDLATGPQLGLMGFWSNDSDDPGTGAVRAWNEVFGEINTPAAWGTVLYSCASP